MLEILEWIITTLTNNTGVTGVVAATQIFTGEVDMTVWTQAQTAPPMIIVSVISETQRTVPQGARDTLVQIDIWSRTSMLECVQAYEAVIAALQYQSDNASTAYIFWNRLGGASDIQDPERRVWHRSSTFTFWAMKP